MTKVSVIIPVYNTSKYLSECLNSVINQTLTDIEIICINDASTDNSLEILKEYQKKDTRIIILNNEKNSGQATSRNKALKCAKGKYIQFVDSDDWIKENACELIYNKMERFNLDMLSIAATNVNGISGELEDSPRYQFVYLPENFNIDTFNYTKCINFAVHIPVTTPLTIYKNKFLKKNNILFPEGLLYEDNIFFTKALFSAKKYGILKDILYFRRIHNNSTTQNQDKNFNDRIAVAIIITDLILSMNIKNKYLYLKLFTNRELGHIMRVYKGFDSKTREHYKYLYLKIVNYLKNIKECYCAEESKNSFSIQDVDIYKQICFLGKKFKFKDKKLIHKKEFEEILNQLKNIKYCVYQQKQKTDLFDYKINFQRTKINNILNKKHNTKEKIID